MNLNFVPFLRRYGDNSLQIIELASESLDLVPDSLDPSLNLLVDHLAVVGEGVAAVGNRKRPRGRIVAYWVHCFFCLIKSIS
jgi:hypothetical protein